MNVKTSITNELTLKFVNDKLQELTSTGSVQAIKNIDSFLYSGMDQIFNHLKERLLQRKHEILEEIEKKYQEQGRMISEYQRTLQSYEKDLEAIEKLKAFKRTSKIFK